MCSRINIIFTLNSYTYVCIQLLKVNPAERITLPAFRDICQTITPIQRPIPTTPTPTSTSDVYRASPLDSPILSPYPYTINSSNNANSNNNNNMNEQYTQQQPGQSYQPHSPYQSPYQPPIYPGTSPTLTPTLPPPLSSSPATGPLSTGGSHMSMLATMLNTGEQSVGIRGSQGKTNINSTTMTTLMSLNKNLNNTNPRANPGSYPIPINNTYNNTYDSSTGHQPHHPVSRRSSRSSSIEHSPPSNYNSSPSYVSYSPSQFYPFNQHPSTNQQTPSNTSSYNVSTSFEQTLVITDLDHAALPQKFVNSSNFPTSTMRPFSTHPAVTSTATPNNPHPTTTPSTNRTSNIDSQQGPGQGLYSPMKHLPPSLSSTPTDRNTPTLASYTPSGPSTQGQGQYPYTTPIKTDYNQSPHTNTMSTPSSRPQQSTPVNYYIHSHNTTGTRSGMPAHTERGKISTTSAVSGDSSNNSSSSNSSDDDFIIIESGNHPWRGLSAFMERPRSQRIKAPNTTSTTHITTTPITTATNSVVPDSVVSHRVHSSDGYDIHRLQLPINTVPESLPSLSTETTTKVVEIASYINTTYSAEVAPGSPQVSLASVETNTQEQHEQQQQHREGTQSSPIAAITSALVTPTQHPVDEANDAPATKSPDIDEEEAVLPAAHTLALPASPDSPTHPTPSTPIQTATELKEANHNTIAASNNNDNSSGVAGDNAASDNVIYPPSPLSLMPPLETSQVQVQQATSTPTIPSPAPVPLPAPVPVPAPLTEEAQSDTSATSDVVINMTSQTLDPKYIHLLESYNTMKYIVTILVTLGDDLVNEVLTPPSAAASEIEVSLYMHIYNGVLYMCYLLLYMIFCCYTCCVLYYARYPSTIAC